jgi:pimeloyl-ACP methyl ester carboxylesterase
MSTEITGFESERVEVGDLTMHAAVGGDGPAILLLHGFPETHLAWRRVAPPLAERYRVICPDLPGYGASDGPVSVEGYSKRVIASRMLALMRELGHDRFSVVGHDRGGLVAFRAALDHPTVIEHLGILDIIPTADNWAALQGVGGVFAFHLYLLAQPSDLPERVIAADPDTFFGHFLDTWVADDASIPADSRAAYLAAARRPEVVHAICQDYRASAFVDPGLDEQDRDAGRRLTMPVLAMWQDPGDVALPFDPAAIWSGWAPDLRTGVLTCGHFLPEERPDEVVSAITALVDGVREPRR